MDFALTNQSLYGKKPIHKDSFYASRNLNTSLNSEEKTTDTLMVTKFPVNNLNVQDLSLGRSKDYHAIEPINFDDDKYNEVELIGNDNSMNNKSSQSVLNGSVSAAPPVEIKMSRLPKRAPLDLQFSDLTFCVQNGRNKGFKTILNGTSGRFLSGQLTAILGPSGAGKTTLMNILTGYKTSRVSGEILVNGKERVLKSFRRKSCYIMQDDQLLPFLSIQEYMEGAAILKLGGNVSQTERNIVISDILETMSLKDSRLTRVANLSGGEKKRLSIALELVNNPPIMFFDEPTSGLDSRNSYQCISLLKRLAEDGRTIVCTIHQPSARIFEKFDHLYALSEGQCIYRGSVLGLVPFLSSISLECPSYHNPADFLIEVASGEYGSFIPQLVGAVNDGSYRDLSVTTKDSKAALHLDIVPDLKVSPLKEDRRTREAKSTVGEFIYSSSQDTRLEFPPCDHSLLTNHQEDHHTTDYPASFCTQFSVLFKRTFLSIIRDMMLTQLRVAAHIVVGIFIGILYYNVGNEASKVLSNAGCLFFSTLFLIFTSMMPTILTFPLEMSVFVREHLNHWYSLKAYYLAKTMADVPFQILFPVLYVVIMYFLTNQPFEIERFLLYTLLCILISLVAQSIGLAIGAAMDVQQSVFFGPASTIPALLFSGFFVTFSTIPVYMRWLTYLSYVRYAYEGSILAIYGNGRGKLECSEAFCMFKQPSKILEQINVEESHLWFDFLLLIVYFLVMRGLGYFILRWKLRKGR